MTQQITRSGRGRGERTETCRLSDFPSSCRTGELHQFCSRTPANPSLQHGTSMQTCGLTTVRSADVRLACRHAVGGGAARSLSSPVARTTRWTRGSSGVRLSRAERVQVVAAANAPRSCDRNLLVVGPGVLGSLVCQRWLNVRARRATRPRFRFFSTRATNHDASFRRLASALFHFSRDPG